MAKYIDAEELELEYYGLSIHGTMAVKAVLPVFVGLLEQQPTADVAEVKHGEWKPTDEISAFKKPIFECSICGAKEGKHSPVIGNYCWWCGAKMDGGEK